MLSKRLQVKVALYFCAMIALHCAVFWHVERSVADGLPDFSIFYTAGRIVRDGQGSRLYDDPVQESVQHSFLPSVAQRQGAILPFNHPPFEAVLFVPLAHLSYVSAYATWLGFNLVLLISIPFLLRKHMQVLGRVPLYLWLLACVAFFPIVVALLQGQDSVLLLFLYCLAYASLSRGSHLSAGGWLAAGLYKYHLVLPFVLPWWRRKKLMAGFLVVAGSLFLISLAITGWQGVLGYPRYVWETEHNPRYLLTSPQGLTANLRGMVSAATPAVHPGMGTALLVLSSAIVLSLMIYAAGKSTGQESGAGQAVFALNLVGTILLSYHIYLHDLSLLFLSILLVLEVLFTHPAIPKWTRTMLCACIAILFFSPLYMLLSLRYRQMQVMAIVILVFFFALLSLVSFLRAQSNETAAPPVSAGS